jgi:hypothetical protein
LWESSSFINFPVTVMNEKLYLFDDHERTYIGPANHNESEFSFLNRSARSTISRVRDVLQNWFDQYPESDKRELRSKIRDDFYSSFFELFLHELLRRTVTRVEVHPQTLSQRSTRPDFLAEDSSGNRFFAEAVVASDESTEEQARQRVQAVIYDEMNKAQVSDYFLAIKRIINPHNLQPSGKRLRKWLHTQLSMVDYENVFRASSEGRLDDLPNWLYQDGQFTIEIELLPVSRERRGHLDHRPIGAYPLETRWGGSERSLRNSLRQKAGKYGTLGVPFVIAVNTRSKWGTSRYEVMEALFGDIEFVARQDEATLRPSQKPNGLWLSRRGPTYTRVSCVLVTSVGPFNLPTAEICLYHNPWAQFPYGGELTKLPQAMMVKGKMQWLNGLSLGSALELVNGWPGEPLEP